MYAQTKIAFDLKIDPANKLLNEAFTQKSIYIVPEQRIKQKLHATFSLEITPGQKSKRRQGILTLWRYAYRITGPSWGKSTHHHLEGYPPNGPVKYNFMCLRC